MADIQIFNNPEFGEIRTIERDGEPWFVGKDVAQALGYSDTNKAIAMHVDEEDKLNDKTASSLGQRGGKEVFMNNEIMNISGIDCYEKDGVAYLSLEAVARGLGFTKKADSGNEVVNWTRVRSYLAALGVVQKCTTGDFIPENIFYRLAMKAKNEAAEKFQAKVADEIIPAIRKHGAYMTPGTLDQMISSPEFGIRLLTELKSEQERRRALEEKVNTDAPKVLFSEAVSASKNTMLIGELAKVLKQNGIEIGQTRLFAWMRSHGFLIRRAGSDYNMPTQKAMEKGLFEIKETAVTHSDGHVTVSRTPKVTGKGSIYFVNRFLKDRTKGDRQQ